MHITPFQAQLPNLALINDTDQFFPGVKESFAEYFSQGFFTPLFESGVFVYEIVAGNRIFRGLLACADIRDYLQGDIKKHENTLVSKEELHLQLFQQFQAMIKPVLLAYPEVPAVKSWMEGIASAQAPGFSLSVKADGQVHRLWPVTDAQELIYIQELFAAFVPASYIADGHHRCATAAAIYEEKKEHGTANSQLFCALFPSSDLDILDFNRAIYPLDRFDTDDFLYQMADLFDVVVLPEAQKPTQKFSLTMLLHQQWYGLTWKTQILERYRWEQVVLDTQLLNELVLRDLLGIVDERNDPRIAYVEGPLGIAGVEKKISNPANGVGFCLFPVALGDLMALSDHNQVLPPKSTWFEPRMKTGLVVCQL